MCGWFCRPRGRSASLRARGPLGRAVPVASLQAPRTCSPRRARPSVRRDRNEWSARVDDRRSRCAWQATQEAPGPFSRWKRCLRVAALGRVAGADEAGIGAQRGAVRVVAVRAGDAGGVSGSAGTSPSCRPVAHLPSVVEALLEQRGRCVCASSRPGRYSSVSGPRRAWQRALTRCISATRGPRDAAPRPSPSCASAARRIAPRGRDASARAPAGLGRERPRTWREAGVVRLARHVLPNTWSQAPRGERVALRRFVEWHSAHWPVPVLRRLRPVQHVGAARAARQVEERAARPLLRPAVPGDPECRRRRRSSAGTARGRHAEQKATSNSAGAVGPVGADEVASVALREGVTTLVLSGGRESPCTVRSSGFCIAGRGASRASAGNRRGTSRRCSRPRSRAAVGPSPSPVRAEAASARSRTRASPGPRPAGRGRAFVPRASRNGTEGPRQRFSIRISVPPRSEETSSISWLIR